MSNGIWKVLDDKVDALKGCWSSTSLQKNLQWFHHWSNIFHQHLHPFHENMHHWDFSPFTSWALYCRSEYDRNAQSLLEDSLWIRRGFFLFIYQKEKKKKTQVEKHFKMKWTVALNCVCVCLYAPKKRYWSRTRG